MKYIVSLLFSLLCVQTIYAQYPAKFSAQYAKHRQTLGLLLQQQQGGNDKAMRTTGIASQRVIAQSTRDNTLRTLNDSVKLGYAPNFGSTYDYNTMIYPYKYPYNTSPMFNYAGTFTKPQVLFDTFMHWTVDPNTLVYGYYETDYAGYNSLHDMTSYKELYADSSFISNMIFTNTFNTGNYITSGYGFKWSLGIEDSAFKQFFAYNSSNILQKDSTYEYHLGVWRIASRSFYTYDASNDLIEIDNYGNTTDTSFLLPLPEQIKYINTYDASHRLLTVYSYFYDNDSLLPYIKDTFAYSGSYAYHNSWKEYQYDPINRYWAPMFYMTKVINSGGLPDTVNINSFDSIANAWVPQTMDIISYNSSHNPDTLQDYEYNFTRFSDTPSFTTIYYYQNYTNTLETASIEPVNDNAKIFPNPATNSITITGLNVPQNATISVSLVNISGQIVSRQTLGWQGEAQISTSDLVPGVYCLMIQDGTGNIVHRQTVVKTPNP